jgi:phospholipase A-2-activating protein
LQVRAVLLPDPTIALTASRDGSTRLWKQISSTPPTYDPTESSHGATFKTCLAYVPSSKEYPEGLILSAGQDALIEARQPKSTAEGNADAFMIGHGNQVCSLDVSPGGDWLVSGSWDNSARIWGVGRWETEVELQGHTATVWAVLAYDQDTIITGCADKGIRIFDVRGKVRHGFDGKDVVRALVQIPSSHSSGADFASASNDGAIRLWTLKGDLVAELWGHDSFIYSLAVLPSGEIVSSGEDRSIRVWRGTECVQVITLPAISVWSVAVAPNGDIIAGSSDKIARIFSREPGRQAPAEAIAEFNKEVEGSAVPQQQMGEQLNMQDMPGPEFLTQRSGTKEGQSAIIKEADGSPTLYQWSMSQQSWIKIGTVVDSAGSSAKKEYQGKEYDYLFDIDIEDGKPALKLPYNVTQNPYEAATKFLQDNELPLTYLEETANFIIKNTQGATLGQSSAAPVGGADPWGTENRYRPGEVPQSSYRPKAAAPKRTLPQKEYLSIVLGKPTAAAEQIAKRNADQSDHALSKAELDTVSSTAQQLSKYDFSKPSSLGSSTGTEAALQSLLKAGTQWKPPASRLAALDLLRFLAAALKELPASDGDSMDIVAAILASKVFDPQALTANSKLVMISLRLFSNLLYGSGKSLVEEHLDPIIESISPMPKLAATDNAVAIAYTTLCLNISVWLTSSKADRDVAVLHGFQLLERLGELLQQVPAVDHAASATPAAQSTEPAYRALVALGTILVGLRDPEIKSAAQTIDVRRILEQLETKKYLQEPRFQGVASQIREAL